MLDLSEIPADDLAEDEGDLDLLARAGDVLRPQAAASDLPAALSASLPADDPEVRLDWLLRQLPGGGTGLTGHTPDELREKAALALTTTLVDELETRAMESRHGGLRLFVERAWPILEPAVPFVPGYHIDAVCAHLEAITRGELQDLLVLMPPRLGKSLIIGVLWPCWEWGPANLPAYRWIFNTYAEALTVRDSGKRRLIMSAPWYQRRWASRFVLGRDRFRADNAMRYENNHGGFHLATSVNGGNIGEGGNRLIADDPNDLRDIYSEIIREGVIRWWCEVMATRRNNAMAARVVVQQRGHMRDLAGALLEQGGYTVLRLPNEYDPKKHCSTRWSSDPRREAGELLCPARISARQTEELKVTLGEMAYEAQFQQNPVPPEGGILKRKWWRYWAPAFHPLVGRPDENGRPILPLPRRFDQRLHTWDMSFKKTATGSYVCGLAWGRRQTQAYLFGMFRERVGFVDTQTAVQDLLRQFPAPAVYVEGKANGPAIIDSLRLAIPGLIDSDVEQSKEARAYATSPRVQAGNYVLPHPEVAPWVADVLNETQHFPNAAHDDIVDTITLADRYLFLHAQFSERNFVGSTDHGI